MADIEIEEIEINDDYLNSKNQNKEETKPINTVQEEISQKIAQMKDLHGDKFDENSFKSAATAFAETNENIAGLNAESFIKDDKKDNENSISGGEFSFSLQEKDGKITALGTNGEIIEGKNFEEINYKVCDNIKKACLAKGEEPMAYYKSSNNSEDRKKIFSKNALKEGITISGGYSEDSKFWQELKEEYLKNPENKKENWEKMTRYVPDKIMGRAKENIKVSDQSLETRRAAKQIKSLRKGINPKMGESTLVRPPVQPQKLDENALNNIRSGNFKVDR